MFLFDSIAESAEFAFLDPPAVGVRRMVSTWNLGIVDLVGQVGTGRKVAGHTAAAGCKRCTTS